MGLLKTGMKAVVAVKTADVIHERIQRRQHEQWAAYGHPGGMAAAGASAPAGGPAAPTSAVSAIATPVRCSSRSAKATIASTAVAYCSASWLPRPSIASVFERSGVRGDVDGVFTESIEWDDFESALVRGCQDHVRRRAIRVRPQPVPCGHAPPIAGRETGESILRHGRDQVVADPLLVLEKRRGDDRADRVAPSILGTGATAPITEEAGDGVGAAGVERSAQHVQFGHGHVVSLGQRAGDRRRS